MTSKTTNVGAAAGVVVGLVAFIVLALAWGAAWSGFTLSVLWGWFVVPVFGAPSLSVAQAYGLALVVRVASGLKDAESKGDKGFGLVLAKLVLVPPFICGLFLLVGWVAKAWT